MRSVGFFAELGYPGGPSLAEAVGRCPPEVREAVAAYLDGGTTLIAASTWVTDVLDPAAPRIAGQSLLTDGSSLWPESLSHYVRVHGVGVPDDLVALAHDGPPPPLSPEEIAALLNSLPGMA